MPEHAATTCAASTWIIPEALSPPTASSMLASLARVPQSTYPAYPASGGTNAHVKSAATTATDGMVWQRKNELRCTTELLARQKVDKFLFGVHIELGICLLHVAAHGVCGKSKLVADEGSTATLGK